MTARGAGQGCGEADVLEAVALAIEQSLPFSTSAESGWKEVTPGRKRTVFKAACAAMAIVGACRKANKRKSNDPDSGAKLLAEFLNYKWDGLREGRVADRGLPVWSPWGHFQGGKQDLREVADALAAASSSTADGGRTG